MNSDNIRGQRGNAMVYVLIALALFGVLTAVLARQSAQTDNEGLTAEMAEFETTQILAFSQSTQNAVNQMLMSGASVGELDFARPNSPSFDIAPYIYKVFHPDGGGLILKEANSQIFNGTDNDPPPGWYLGRFDNIEWTPTTADDVVLTAHQISRPVCESINKKITGETTIPALAAGNLADFLIDDVDHSGTNGPLEATDCADCEGYATLCISNAGATMFSFYTIIEGL